MVVTAPGGGSPVAEQCAETASALEQGGGNRLFYDPISTSSGKIVFTEHIKMRRHWEGINKTHIQYLLDLIYEPAAWQALRMLR